MFPNVRLFIVTLFTSVIALSCGFGVFAAFRVNHEPLSRLPTVSAPLQLVADVATLTSMAIAAGGPLDVPLRLSDAEVGDAGATTPTPDPATPAAVLDPQADAAPQPASQIDAPAVVATPAPASTAPTPANAAPAVQESSGADTGSDAETVATAERVGLQMPTENMQAAERDRHRDQPAQTSSKPKSTTVADVSANAPEAAQAQTEAAPAAQAPPAPAAKTTTETKTATEAKTSPKTPHKTAEKPRRKIVRATPRRQRAVARVRRIPAPAPATVAAAPFDAQTSMVQEPSFQSEPAHARVPVQRQPARARRTVRRPVPRQAAVGGPFVRPPAQTAQ